MSILSNLQAGNTNVETIKEGLFDVINVPLFTNQSKFETPENGMYSIYKSEGGLPLSGTRAMSKDYTPQQPTFLFDSFTKCLVDNTSADLSKIKYHEMKGGAKIRFEVPVKTIEFTNMAGKKDESIISLNIQTGFDGNTATSLYLSMFRMICTNGMKANVTEFKSSFKNTIGNVGKIQLLCNDVTKALDTTDNLSDIITKLNSIQINTERKNEFIEKVLGIKLSERADFTTRKRNILESIEESIALEISRSGGNLWGLLNGVTHYTNHSVKTFDAITQTSEDHQNTVNQYIFSETGEKMNSLAFNTVLQMAN